MNPRSLTCVRTPLSVFFSILIALCLYKARGITKKCGKMWLINITDTQALHLEPFLGDPPAQYAILSHTWGDDEVTFDKFNAMTLYSDSDFDRMELGTNTDIRNSAGFVKILNAALLARRHGFVYLWVDTCCIDKASSAELSESINSMYLWYLKATVCYAYLSDVHPDGIRSMGQRESQFRASRWFTRGWTLQELIAPRVVEFYASDWSLMDTKKV